MGTTVNKYSLRLVKETSEEYNIDEVKVRNPEEACNIFKEILWLNERPQEVFAMITLDVKNNVTGVMEVSTGGLSSSIVHPRDVFQRAILQNAGGIILGHNHPSGDIKPSQQDNKITAKLVESGEILGIEVCDHLIIGIHGNFLSMKEEGII